MVETGNLSHRRGAKSAEAFRTISEVAQDLDVPQHVLRFWETKFAQVRPLKRGGGRRYYRPEDVELLRSIRALLYSDGYTIKGVQKLLREGGLRPAEEGEGKRDGTAATPPARRAQPAPPQARSEEPAKKAAGGLTQRQRRTLTEVLEELEALRELLDSAR